MKFKNDSQRKAVMAKYARGEIAWSVPHTSKVKLESRFKDKNKYLWSVKIIKPRGMDIPTIVKEKSLRKVYSPEKRFEIRKDESDPKWTKWQIWDKDNNTHISSYTSFWDANLVRENLIKEKRGLK